MKLQKYSMIFVLALTACGKNAPDPITQGGTHWQITGPLSEKAAELTKYNFADDCDTALHDIRMELSNAVDKKTEELKNDVNQSKRDSDQKTVAFHGSSLIDLEVEAPKKTGYYTYESGWRFLHNYYKKNLDKQPEKFWGIVNSGARSLLSDDIRRVRGVNYNIDHNTAPLITDLNNAIIACSKTEDCGESKLTKLQVELLKSNPIYSRQWKIITQDPDAAKRKQAVTYLMRQLDLDKLVYGYIKNTTVTSSKPGSTIQLELPLGAKGFSQEDRDLLSRLVARWKNKTHELKLKFMDDSKKDKDGIYDIFTLFFDTTPGQRDYTNRYTHELHIIQFGDVRGFAHEIGHALGVPDHYYKIWDSSQCTYTTEAREDDIMSDHDTGSVTDDVWKWIEQTYPVK